MSSEMVSDIVRRIANGPLADRLVAVEELGVLGPYGRLHRIGMPLEEGLIVLRAACEDWPAPAEPWRRGPVAQCLLLSLCSVPHPEFCELLLQNLTRFSEDKTEWQALMLLSHMPQRQAAETWIELYRQRLKRGKGTPPPFADWDTQGLHADIVLPALLEFARTDDAWLSERLYSHVLRYIKSPEHAAVVAAQLIETYIGLRLQLEASQCDEGVGWRWRGDYLYERYRASRLLELFGYLAKNPAEEMLRSALRYADPLLRTAAAVALLRQGEPVDRAVLRSIAADPECRVQLFEALRSIKKGRAFPREFATQESMAESDMVNWLIADVDAGPDEIELMEWIDVGDRKFFVFQFRFLPPHTGAKDGWMAGVSGPWPVTGLERVRQCGGTTYSHFEAAEAKTPAEHVKRVIGGES